MRWLKTKLIGLEFLSAYLPDNDQLRRALAVCADALWVAVGLGRRSGAQRLGRLALSAQSDTVFGHYVERVVGPGPQLNAGRVSGGGVDPDAFLVLPRFVVAGVEVDDVPCDGVVVVITRSPRHLGCFRRTARQTNFSGWIRRTWRQPQMNTK